MCSSDIDLVWSDTFDEVEETTSITFGRYGFLFRNVLNEIFLVHEMLNSKLRGKST